MAENMRVKAKSKLKVMSMEDITLNDDPKLIGIVNPRQPESLSVSTMMEDILGKGRIVDPPHVEKVTKKVNVIKDGVEVKDEHCAAVTKEVTIYVALKGNRRTAASKELLKNPSLAADVKFALEHTEVIVYEGLTPDERESLIYDHGSVKGLSRYEVANAIWSLADRNLSLSETDIARKMYFQLASFTGNNKQLAKCEAMTDPKAKLKAISQWFHGTLGQYILAAYKMGVFVREQFMLTLKAESNGQHPIPEGTKVQLKCTTGRIKELWTAMNSDKKDGSWEIDVVSGNAKGNSFTPLLESFLAQDRGEASAEEKTKRPSVKQLEEGMGSFRTPHSRLALKMCAGTANDDERSTLIQLDEAAYQMSIKMEVVGRALNNIDDVEVKGLLHAILFSDAPTVEKLLIPFVKVATTV